MERVSLSRKSAYKILDFYLGSNINDINKKYTRIFTIVIYEQKFTLEKIPNSSAILNIIIAIMTYKQKNMTKYTLEAIDKANFQFSFFLLQVPEFFP